tara:strand:- start:1979 stop:3517 length:1539 start_codon:yes stop_codon:yes gene_type:complete
MQPINYGVQIQDPTQSFLSAFQTGASIQESRLKQEQQQQQLANQKLIQEGFAKLRQPNATAADYANLAMVLPETQAKSVRESFNMLSGERQNAALQQSGQVFSAFRSGQPEIAISLLDRQIEGKRNSGDEEGAKFLETWRNVAKENPKATEDYFGFTISQMPGGDKVIESAVKLGGELRAQSKAPAELRQAIAAADKAVADATTAQATATNAADRAKADADKAVADANAAKVKAKYAEQVEIAGLNKTNWDINNLRSQIGDRSARLNLDTQKTAADVAAKMSDIQKNLTDIPADTRKLINESAVLAATSKQSAGQFNDLAKRLDEAGGGYGVFSSASDFLKKGAGFQGGMTQLRQEYTRLRNTAAIKSLPPGPATDKDIAMALKGFPSDNASAGDLSSFLRGMAKLQDVDASINNAKTDWLAQNNGTLTRAKNTFVAGDYATKPGETFNDFSQRIIGDVSKKYQSPEQTAEERRQQLISQIPTNQAQVPAAAAAAAPANIRSQADAILRGGQ